MLGAARAVHMAPGGGPPTFVASTTARADGAGVKGLTLNVPAGRQSGDLLLAFLTCDSFRTWSAPAGWTAVEVVEWGSTIRAQGLFRRIANGTEGASYFFPHTGSDGTSHGAMLCYRGPNPVTPVGPLTRASANDATTSVTAPTVTAATPGLLISWLGRFPQFAGTRTPPAGMTTRSTSSGPQQYTGEHLIADELIAGGATGERTATNFGSGTAVELGWNIVLPNR